MPDRLSDLRAERKRLHRIHKLGPDGAGDTAFRNWQAVASEIDRLDREIKALIRPRTERAHTYNKNS